MDELVANGDIVIESHEFSTSGLNYDQKPQELTEAGRSDFIFVSGDWNYRMVTGNQRWGVDQKITDVILTNKPMAIVRTPKNETMIAADKEIMDRHAEKDEYYFRKGRAGMMQFVPANSSSLLKEEFNVLDVKDPSLTRREAESVTPKDKEAAPGVSSPMTEKEKGGSDLNPNEMDMKMEKERGIGLQAPVVTPEVVEQFRGAVGFSPVIINVAPIINLPLLLGLTESEDVPYADSQTKSFDMSFIDKYRNKYIREYENT